MNNKYVCDIDGSIFSSEEELLRHLKEKYVTVFIDKKTDVSDIYELLKVNFPEWEVNVRNGGGWYAEYIINLKKDKTDIEQYYGNEKSDTDKCYTYKGNPENNVDLISAIRWKIDKADELTGKIKSIGDFDDVYCSQFGHGYASNEHYFQLCYKLKGENDYRSDNYYPWGSDITENEFTESFKQYFVNKLEGLMAPRYTDGYFDTYTIDDVPIDALISRAKKVRLEIIE